MQEITNQEIIEDRDRYKTRIEAATAALQALPNSAYRWAAQRELDKKRRELIGEIEHNARLLRYAEESLRGVELVNEFSQ